MDTQSTHLLQSLGILESSIGESLFFSKSNQLSCFRDKNSPSQSMAPSPHPLCSVKQALNTICLLKMVLLTLTQGTKVTHVSNTS